MELIRMHKEEGLSFKNVISFNLDEYYPISKTSLQSYNSYMRNVKKIKKENKKDCV